MGGRTENTSSKTKLTKSQENRIFDYKTKYSGMEAITESYTEVVNGVRVIKTRTRYRKKRRKKK